MNMNTQQIVIIVVIGIVAGWLASLVVGGGGILRYLITGLVGAFVGGFVFNTAGWKLKPRQPGRRTGRRRGHRRHHRRHPGSRHRVDCHLREGGDLPPVRLRHLDVAWMPTCVGMTVKPQPNTRAKMVSTCLRWYRGRTGPRARPASVLR